MHMDYMCACALSTWKKMEDWMEVKLSVFSAFKVNILWEISCVRSSSNKFFVNGYKNAVYYKKTYQKNQVNNP